MKTFKEILTESNPTDEAVKKARTKSEIARNNRKLMLTFSQFLKQHNGIDKVVVYKVIDAD